MIQSVIDFSEQNSIKQNFELFFPCVYYLLINVILHKSNSLL